MSDKKVITPIEALRLIASGWAVIESDGRHITIEPPEYDDEAGGELVVDTMPTPTAWLVEDNSGLWDTYSTEERAKKGCFHDGRITALYA